MRKHIAAIAAVTLTLGLSMGATATAWAEEPPPADTTAPAVVDEQPAPDPAPAAAPVTEPAPAVEAPAADPVVEPDPEPAPAADPEGPLDNPATFTVATTVVEKLPICHSGAGQHWVYIAVDNNGYNGHQHHSNDVYGLSEADCLAKNPTEEPKDYGYGTALWQADNDGGDPLWPQTLIDYTPTAGPELGALDALAEGQCGWFQADIYRDDALTATLVGGGHLYGPSNPTESWPGDGYQSSYSKQWFESSGCAVTPDAPSYVCGDVAPTVPADSEQLQYKVAFNADLNRWRVKITAVAPYTLASGNEKDEVFIDRIVCPPNHQVDLTKECGSWSATLTNPVAVEGDTTQQTASFVVFVDGQFFNAYAVEAGGSQSIGGTFPEDSGDHTVVIRSGSAQGDEKLAKAVVCTDCYPPEPIPVHPRTVGGVDYCGTDDDVITGAGDTELWTFIVTDNRVDGVGTVIVEGWPATGYTVEAPGQGDTYTLSGEGGNVAVWSFDFTNEACPTGDTPTPPPATGRLASTSGGDARWLGIPVGLLLMAGVSLVAFGRRRITE